MGGGSAGAGRIAGLPARLANGAVASDHAGGGAGRRGRRRRHDRRRNGAQVAQRRGRPHHRGQAGGHPRRILGRRSGDGTGDSTSTGRAGSPGIGALLPEDPGAHLAGEIAAWPGPSGSWRRWGGTRRSGVRTTTGVAASPSAKRSPGSTGCRHGNAGGTRSGRAVDVDDEGRLVVETAAGQVRLDAGEVRSVRRATVIGRDRPDDGGRRNVTVLKGEGKVPILFGSTSISVASRVHSGYLSRPDLTGEWPTVILVPDFSGVTPAVKDLCRKLARRELAAVAVDPLRRDRVSRLWADRQAPVSAADLDADIDDIVTFVTNPSGSWSSAGRGFGVLGIGSGGAAACRLAVRRPGLAVALVAAPVQPDLARLGGGAARPLRTGRRRGAGGRSGGGTVWTAQRRGGDLRRRRRRVHRRRQPGFDLEAAADALERLVAFFLRHLPPPPA